MATSSDVALEPRRKSGGAFGGAEEGVPAGPLGLDGAVETLASHPSTGEDPARTHTGPFGRCGPRGLRCAWTGAARHPTESDGSRVPKALNLGR